MNKLSITIMVGFVLICSSTGRSTFAQTEGLVGYWSFDEGSGSIAHDYSGNNHDGTIYGATWTTGKIGNALSFDGSNDWVDIPDDISPEYITLGAWIYPTGFDDGPGDQGNPIITKETGRGIPPWSESFAWRLRITPRTHNLQLQCFTPTGTGGGSVISDTVLEMGNWYHVAGTYDGTRTKVYIDGNLEGSYTASISEPLVTSDLPTGIGHLPNWSVQWFDGIIDEVRIYNQALSESDIGDLASETPEPPPGTTLSGIVFDDKNDNRTYNPGEEISGALISAGEGTPVTSGPNGRYIISELTPPDVWLQVTIDGDDYWAYCHIEDGENQFDIMINTSAEEQFNVCSANVACATGFAGLLPYVGKAADHVSVALDICATQQRLDAGDVLGATIGIVKLTVNFLNTLIEDAVFIITGSAAETPYQLVDAVEASINCAESQLWEYAYDHCDGYSSCLWEGFKWLGESIVGIFTGSPVDIRVIDSQGNVMELDANGYTKNELSSPGWIFKGPDDKELALIFDADDDYTVLIVGRPEAGASSTFYLQMMQQSAGGSQQIHTYTNVSISAQGVAFAQIGDNPVLEVDVDGDGTVDLNLLPDSLAMQVVPLLPSSDKNKAGRTMPVKFSLRRPERVDPAMPFVYDEDLEIRIYDSADPGTILQTSRHGDTARDYRIDTADELYITNFRTKKEPAEYVVEIWRTDLAFQVGSFSFQTLK